MEIEKVVELFVEKQKARLTEGTLRSTEYDAFLAGVNDALSYLKMEYVPAVETIKKSKRIPVDYPEIEEKYSRLRQVAMYKNSFLRVADIAKQTKKGNEHLAKVATTIQTEL